MPENGVTWAGWPAYSKDKEIDPMRLGKIAKGVFLTLLTMLLLSCSDTIDPVEQAKQFFTYLQSKDIDKCLQMSYAYQTQIAKLRDEPQFKQKELYSKVRHNIKEELFNEYKNDSIVYVFSFPCQWNILETKEMTVDTPDSPYSSMYRVFVVVKYTSDNQSPESVPLFNKEGTYNYKLKEIILHCDFEAATGLYLGWGTDKHIPW
jgi:hypothetical protein